MRVGRPSKDSLGVGGLGQALIDRRRAAGISRAALAAKAGLSNNTLMKVEQGQTRDPGVLKVAALCRALSVSIDELVHDAERHQLPREVTAMTHGIVSVGYEGRTIGDFVPELVRAGVQTVADVRLNAISRKAGFSKTRLREALAAAGINYCHMRSLGNAKENRQPFWDGRVEEGRRVFREMLHSPDAEASLEELSALARDQVVAVLCFETDVEMCHRKVIIDEIVNTTSVPVAALRV
jgi:transcriptional regulator with XRE-family HTH domain